MLRTSRARLAIPGLIALVIAAGIALPGAAAARPGRVTIVELMIGIGCVESRGDYFARNPNSGAYGKYQIMPFNWPVWAGWYLGDRRARQTPRNQEIVAREELFALRRYLDSGWPRVAYWWLTGLTNPDRDEWSSIARWYVGQVMTYARRARTDHGRASIPASCLSTPGDIDGGTETGADVRVTTAWLNVRMGPGIRFRRIDLLDPGTRVRVLDRARDRVGRRWFRVRLPDDGRGWVAAWYTREP